MYMEIDEFLTRIGIKEANPTIFRIEERATLDAEKLPVNGEVVNKLRGIRTHTNTKDRSVSIVGFIVYDRQFPEQIFALPSNDLRNVIAETDRIEIIGSKLMGYGNSMDFAFNLQVMEKGKGLHLRYDNTSITLVKDVIKRILKIDGMITAESVFVDTDGKIAKITLQNKTGDTGKVIIASDFPEFHARFEDRFIECLKLLGDNEATLNLDGYNPNREHKAHGLGRIELVDSNAIVDYYINEVTQKVQEQKKTTKKEKEETEDPEKSEEA